MLFRADRTTAPNRAPVWSVEIAVSFRQTGFRRGQRRGPVQPALFRRPNICAGIVVQPVPRPTANSASRSKHQPRLQFNRGATFSQRSSLWIKVERLDNDAHPSRETWASPVYRDSVLSLTQGPHEPPVASRARPSPSAAKTCPTPTGR